MRLIAEGVVVITGALGLFKYVYSSWLKLRRNERQARLRERREEEAWLDSQIDKEQ